MVESYDHMAGSPVDANDHPSNSMKYVAPAYTPSTLGNATTSLPEFDPSNPTAVHRGSYDKPTSDHTKDPWNK